MAWLVLFGGDASVVVAPALLVPSRLDVGDEGGSNSDIATPQA